MTSTLARSSQPSHEIDLDIQKVVLDVVNRKLRGLDTRIENSVIDGSLERTIDGSSTLTLVVHDPRRALLLSGMLAYAIDVRLDRLMWRLVKVAKQDDDLTLTFEDREVAYLRQHYSPKKASRAKVTRAEFALSLVREVREGGGITFVCPELHVRQKVAIENDRQKRTDKSRASNRQKGLARATALTVKGAGADAGQKRLAERILDVADSIDAGEKPSLALMEACIVESLIRNLSGGDRDSRGVLQVRDSTAQTMAIDNRDPSQCANAFLRRGFTGRGGAIDLARAHPSWSAGQIAQAVQGSAHPERYDKARSEASAFITSYGGMDGDGVDTTEVVRRLPYQFRRGSADGEREDSWTCLRRLAEEVNWRCFMSAGSLYFISEGELLKAKPRLLISEQTPGVTAIDFDIDVGKAINEVQLSARASRWVAAPGAVVELTDCGVADGRWLVATIQRGLFDADATITLRRPSKALLEPAAETETTSFTTAARFGAAGSALERAYRAAKAIHEKRYPYVWGGGHVSAGSPSGGGYDCSGSVCAVLAAGGMGYRLGGPVDVSGTIARTWGQPGRGEKLTVFANEQHVFIVFHVDQSDEHWGTGDWGKGWGGAGFNPNMHPTAGFTARHWPGG